MNKSHREDELSRKSKGESGGKLEKMGDYGHSGWAAVQSMLKGEHPTTNLATIECGKGGGHSTKHHKEESKAPKSGKKSHFAAGGVAKVRKGEY
jgi:hypothetical protein